MRTIGLLANLEKPNAGEVGKRIETLFHESDVRVHRRDIGRYTDFRPIFEQLPQDCEMVIVLGGDGTLLGVARSMVRAIPLLGINMGRLGFLAQSEPSDIDDTVRRIVERAYQVERRIMLEATVERDGQVLSRITGLNDVGVAKSTFARMVTLEIFVDDVYVDAYSGDGVIVSTPTGSTAYSLSCGGPIVLPQLEVMLITPICPHTLVARPMVIHSNQKVRVVAKATHDDISLTVDGQVSVPLQKGDFVRVHRAQTDALLVKWDHQDFHSVLRTKLRDPDVQG